MKIKSFFNFIYHKRNILAEGGWVLSGQVIVAIINMAGIRIVTEFLSPEILGEATLWVGIAILLKNIFVSPFLNYQIRFYPEYRSQNKGISYNSVALKILLILVICSSVLFIFSTLVLMMNDVIKINFLILFLTLIYFSSDSIRSFGINILQAERRQKEFAIYSILESFITYLTVFLLILYLPKAESYIAAFVIAILFIIILMKIFIPIKINFKFKTEENIELFKNEAFKFALPLVPVAILSWIMNLSNRYIIEILGNTADVGIFIASFSIASRPFIILSGIATNFFRPILIEVLSSNEIIKSRFVFFSWLITVTIIGTILMLLFFFGAKIIAAIFLSNDYRTEAIKLFIFIALGYFFLAIYQVFENFLFTTKNTKIILKISIVSTIVFIASNFALISIYSTFGASLSISIGFFCYLVLGFVYSKDKIKYNAS